jgi:hypothetical protein
VFERNLSNTVKKMGLSRAIRSDHDLEGCPAIAHKTFQVVIFYHLQIRVEPNREELKPPVGRLPMTTN